MNSAGESVSVFREHGFGLLVLVLVETQHGIPILTSVSSLTASMKILPDGFVILPGKLVLKMNE